MTHRIRLALRASTAGALVALAFTAGSATAAPVGVTLRVEGRTQTIFDGPVTTDGHDVTTPTGGTHRCDGTNGASEPSPGPTATAALDDAARLAGFTFDGNYGNFGIDDYFLTRVANDTVDESSEYWSLWIAFGFSDKGGCQKRIRQGDDVLWAFSPFSHDRALKLEGPGSATTGQPLQVKVTNGANGNPEAGATVGGSVTGPDGNATLTFAEPGVYRLKAEATNAVRSNSLVVCADPAGAEPCTSSDRTAPTAQLLLPRFASDLSNSRRFAVAWQGNDGQTGSGVSGFSLDVREPGSNEWRPLQQRTAAVSQRVRSKAGASYDFRVSAFDRANNRGPFATDTIVVPVDDRDRRRVGFSRGWQRLRRSAAWGRHVVRTREEDATISFRYTGRRVALIGRKLRNGGRLLVDIDGHRKVLNMRGRPRHRSVLYVSARRRETVHDVRLIALGGGPVEIDALAPVKR